MNFLKNLFKVNRQVNLDTYKYRDNATKRLEMVMNEVVLSALSARVFVALELLNQGHMLDVRVILADLLKVLPKPTDEGVLIARQEAFAKRTKPTVVNFYDFFNGR